VLASVFPLATFAAPFCSGISTRAATFGLEKENSEKVVDLPERETLDCSLSPNGDPVP
jgi:hypothetical protein